MKLKRNIICKYRYLQRLFKILFNMMNI